MKHMDWRIIWKLIGNAAAASVLALLLLSGMMSALVTTEILDLGTGKKIVAGAVLLLLLINAWIASRKAPNKRLMIAVLTTALTIVALLIGKSIVFPGGELTSPWHICASMMMSLPAGLIASGKKGRKR